MNARIFIAATMALALTACSSQSDLPLQGNGDPGQQVGQQVNPPNQNNGGQNNSQNNDNQNNSQDNNSSSPDGSGLTATHRSGQTFLVWQESGNASYHIYRSSSQITQNNLASANKLTQRWGALDANTSRNLHGSAQEPANFVIRDQNAPVADNNGLFVHTVQNGEQGSAYYAVTTVSGNSESLLWSLGSPVNEGVATPRPVLVSTKNGGLGRLYTQYMDYQNWNPTLNGYAYSYTLALPPNYSTSRRYPLQLTLHAYGEGLRHPPQSEFPGWDFIQMFPHDPGEPQGTIHSWWYGYAADHNYKTQGRYPTGGNIANFTEQRVLSAIQAVINDSAFRVDTNLIHIVGNSMGASGALAYAMRYPNVFSGIYASQPMTNYSASPTFQDNFAQLWGSKQSNLQIANAGPNSAIIRRYGVGGSATGVWNWMNHLEQLRRRSGDGFAFMAVDHGKSDSTIDWQTQGRPLVQALTDAKAGFSANAVAGVGHGWLGYGAVITPLFGLGYGDEAPWRYPLTLSFPSITNASGSGAINPGTSGDDSYNMNIEWSTNRNGFHQPIVDTGSSYEISLRSTAEAQTANVSPRRTSAFKPSPGSVCQWTAKSNNNGQTLLSGNATVSGNGAVTATNVPINTSNGTRLSFSC